MIIAVLITAIIALLGMSAMMTATIDTAVSVNFRGATESLISAEGTVELIVPWLAYDLRNDPDGWANEFLIVPEPTGSTPTGMLQDASGAVTGVAGAYYYDLRDLDSNGSADQTVPSLEPYAIPAAAVTAMVDPDMYPEGSVEIRLRNLSNNTAPGDGETLSYLEDAVSVNVLATSDISSDGGIGGPGAPVMSDIEVSFGGRRHSMWQNAIYSARNELKVSKKDVVIHGSLHAVNLDTKTPDYSALPPCDPDEVAIKLGKGGQIVNHYGGLDATLQAALIALPDGSLEAELRAYGYVEIKDEDARAGQPEAEAPAGSPGALDAAYVCGQVFTGSHAGNHWENELDDYDITPPELLDATEDDYTDTMTGIVYDSYMDYLSGSDAGPGASALDIGYLGGKGSLTTRFTRSSILIDPDKSFAYDLYLDQAKLVSAQFDYAPTGTTFEYFLELEDGSGTLDLHTGPMDPGDKGGSSKGAVCKPSSKKEDCPWPTGVFAMIKTIPAGVPGDGNPYPSGTRHGIVFIPADVEPLASSVAVLEDVIGRLNDVLSTPLPSPIDEFGAIPAASQGRIYGAGLMLTGKNTLNHDSKKDRYAPLRFGGSMTMAAAKKGEIRATGEVLPLRTFPCPDSLGLVAGKKFKIEDPYAPLMTSLIWAEEVEIKDGAQLAGAAAVWDKFKLGEGTHLVAAPSMTTCLPPGIDDDSVFRMELRGWTSR